MLTPELRLLVTVHVMFDVGLCWGGDGFMAGDGAAPRETAR
jgi:hypothetical protein